MCGFFRPVAAYRGVGAVVAVKNSLHSVTLFSPNFSSAHTRNPLTRRGLSLYQISSYELSSMTRAAEFNCMTSRIRGKDSSKTEMKLDFVVRERESFMRNLQHQNV